MKKYFLNFSSCLKSGIQKLLYPIKLVAIVSLLCVLQASVQCH